MTADDQELTTRAASASKLPEPLVSRVGADFPVVALALAVALHGLVYLVLLPPWMGEDEPWHFEYARDLALAESAPESREELSLNQPRLSNSQQAVAIDTGASSASVLTTQAELVDSMQRHHFWQRVPFSGWEFGASGLDQAVFNHWETYQPSLYYRLCAAVLRVSGVRAVESQLWLLRGLSFFCYLGIAWLTYKVANLLSAERSLAIAAVLIVAFVPMHARQAAVVNNDVGVRLFAAAAFWSICHFVVRRGSATTAASLLAFTGLALASKATAVGLAAPVCFAFVHYFSRGRGVRRFLFISALSLGFCLAAVTLYWTIVKPAGEGGLAEILPWSLEDARRQLRIVFSLPFLTEFMRTFVGTFNWYTRNLSLWVYLVVLIALLAGLLGSLFATVRSRLPLERVVLLLCWLAVLCQLSAMGLRGFAAARFFFPVLPALSLLLSVGWLAPFSPAWRSRMLVALVTGLVVLDGIAVWNGLFPSQYLEWGS